MTEAKRKIKKFDFSGGEAHVALVDSAANAQEVLVMKSAVATEEEITKAVEVNVKISLLEFLTRYLGLWIDDAEVVAGMLGMTFDDLYDESDINSFEEMVQTNLDKVQVNKSESSQKFIEAFEAFKSKHFDKETPSSVAAEKDGEQVSKTEDKPITKQEDTNTMSDAQYKPEDVQEMISKALADQQEEIRKSIAAEYEEKTKQTTAELEVLKAKDEAREEKAFIAKAAEFKEHLGAEEEAQAEAVQALAKGLRKMEADAEMKPALDLLKSLKETVEKSSLLDEVGSVSVEKSSDMTEGDRMVQKMAKEQGVSENEAYAKLLVERPELF